MRCRSRFLQPAERLFFIGLDDVAVHIRQAQKVLNVDLPALKALLCCSAGANNHGRRFTRAAAKGFHLVYGFAQKQIRGLFYRSLIGVIGVIDEAACEYFQHRERRCARRNFR